MFGDLDGANAVFFNDQTATRREHNVIYWSVGQQRDDQLIPKDAPHLNPRTLIFCALPVEDAAPIRNEAPGCTFRIGIRHNREAARRRICL